MKIIVSHDVDNLTVFEHTRDLIVPKYLVRCAIEWSNGSINRQDLKCRLNELKSNKWQNIHEIIKYNTDNEIPTTFFIALKRGLGLSYNKKTASQWIQSIGTICDVGVHGIAYDNYLKMKKESDFFRQVSGLNCFGIRMHYLRNHPKTGDYLNQLGYLFDSTEWGIKDCHQVQALWEFPLHMMDVDLIFGNGRFQTETFKEIQIKTRRRIEKAEKNKLRYFTLNFHDRYFSDASRIFKDWYIWVIEYFKEREYAFINFRNAVNELEKNDK
jgi:hypothetical protein